MRCLPLPRLPFWKVRDLTMYTAKVITVSDRSFSGQRLDGSGPTVKKMLQNAGYETAGVLIVPDEQDAIEAALTTAADDEDTALVVTTGGTGFAPRDVTPEATLAVCDRMAPGIPEAMRAASMTVTPRACLSRSAAGIRKNTLIINLPGSPKAAAENLAAVLPLLAHGLDVLRGQTKDCAEI